MTMRTQFSHASRHIMHKLHRLQIGIDSVTCSSLSMVTKISTRSALKSPQFSDFGVLMARGKRGRLRAPAMRRQRALEASERLSKILQNPWDHSASTVNEAASQSWQIGRRHRIGLNPKIRMWICRGCQAPLRPGVNAKIRIRQGRRITTCNQCGRISRRGPDFPHEVNE